MTRPLAVCSRVVNVIDANPPAARLSHPKCPIITVSTNPTLDWATWALARGTARCKNSLISVRIVGIEMDVMVEDSKESQSGCQNWLYL
jgi:hypothetical protein